MPQSNTIFFFVFAAFLLFITARGELPKYMGFLLASPKAGPVQSQTGSLALPPSTTAANINATANLAGKLAAFA